MKFLSRDIILVLIQIGGTVSSSTHHNGSNYTTSATHNDNDDPLSIDHLPNSRNTKNKTSLPFPIASDKKRALNICREWDKVGATTNAYTGRSVALSHDGSIIAMGLPGNNAGGFMRGSVQVFQLGSSWEWSSLGGYIDGIEDYGEFGSSIALSQYGNIISIGAPNSYFHSGRVEMYKYDTRYGWEMMGSSILGTQAWDRLGQSVAISSTGDIVVLSLLKGDTTGQVETFKYDTPTNSWNRFGQILQGRRYSEFGFSVSISSDGWVIAVGAPNGAEGADPYVEVYEFDHSVEAGGQWTLKGERIGHGDGWYDKFGSSVSLSGDGNIVLVGAPSNEWNGRGRVRVFSFDDIDNEEAVWRQLGQDLRGRRGGDKFGHSVSIAKDGYRILIGMDSFTSKTGYARLYEFNAAMNKWIKTHEIEDDEGTSFGYSVALSALSGEDTVMAIGAPESTTRRGRVHLLEAFCVPTNAPSASPTNVPSPKPSVSPTDVRSSKPSVSPTSEPSKSPRPTRSPRTYDTKRRWPRPSANPSTTPSKIPSSRPSSTPSKIPTSAPVRYAKRPKGWRKPSTQPSAQPSYQPSKEPTYSPSCSSLDNPKAKFRNGFIMRTCRWLSIQRKKKIRMICNSPLAPKAKRQCPRTCKVSC